MSTVPELHADAVAFRAGRIGSNVAGGEQRSELQQVHADWLRDELKEWSNKYFERESAWAFTPKNRLVYLSANGETAWFEELLDTSAEQAVRILRTSNETVQQVQQQFASLAARD